MLNILFSAVILVVGSSLAASAADKLRIGYSGATVSNAMLWVTDEGKLFQKNGIEPQILYLQTTLGQTAMIAGEIDMCVYSGSLLSSARLQGVDVVMITSFLNKPLYRLVVRPEIKTVADLKGKRLGITRFGTVTDSMSRLLVGKLGLDPDKDVSYVQVGDVPVLLASLSTGRIIDGAIIQPPYYLKAVASGMRVLVNMQEMEIAPSTAFASNAATRVGVSPTWRIVTSLSGFKPSFDTIRRVPKSDAVPKRETPSRLPFKSAAVRISGRTTKRETRWFKKPAIIVTSAPCNRVGVSKRPV